MTGYRVIFTFQRDGVTDEWRVWMISYMICTLDPTLFDRTNQEKSDVLEKWRVQGTGEDYAPYFVERPEENKHLEDLRLHVRIILKWILKKYYGNTLKGFICIAIENKCPALVDMVMNIRFLD
jgi:hypothetical protein